MKKKWSLVLTLALVLALVFSSSAFAFTDLKHVEGKDEIIALTLAGILSGIKQDLFGPENKLTVAEAVKMIVKGLKLNIDNIRFIKEPKASDYYTKVPDNAWYASAFIIALHNGLDLPKDIDPKAQITREQFTHYLYKGLITTGEYAFIKIYINIKDEAQITPAYMDAIQHMLIAKIATLDKNQKFYPKSQLTRAQAAVMLSRTIEFVKTNKPIPPVDPSEEYPGVDDKVTMTIDKISNDVNKVTVAWGEKPHAGFTITIDSIVFLENNEARIYYTLHYPQPENSYAQVITYPKAETFVSSKYTPVVDNNAKMGSSSSSVLQIAQ